MEQIYFGRKIAELRKARGMTQESLAQRLGITNQAVSKWESDQCCPDIMQLPVLADIFEISMDALFGRESIPPVAEPTQQIILHELPWEDNNDLHAVCYVGHKLVRYKDIPAPGGRRDIFSFSCMGFDKKVSWSNEPVILTYSGDVENIHSDFSVECPLAEIRGNVRAGDGVNCGNVGGDVHAGDSVTCDKVQGHVRAGDNVTCGDVEGNVQAGDSVSCTGSVGGSVSAGDGVECADVGGDVQAGNGVTCGSVAGSVNAQDSVECTQIGGNVTAGDSVECRGSILGDVKKVGDSVQCSGDIHGSVSAGGGVRCGGSVGGDVSAEEDIFCGSVSGSASAGGNLTCSGTIGGNAFASGDLFKTE